MFDGEPRDQMGTLIFLNDFIIYGYQWMGKVKLRFAKVVSIKEHHIVILIVDDRYEEPTVQVRTMKHTDRVLIANNSIPLKYQELISRYKGRVDKRTRNG